MKMIDVMVDVMVTATGTGMGGNNNNNNNNNNNKRKRKRRDNTDNLKMDKMEIFDSVLDKCKFISGSGLHDFQFGKMKLPNFQSLDTITHSCI